MPRKTKRARSEVTREPVPSEVLDQFVRQGALTAEEVEAAVQRFKKALIERALGAELTHHLGYPPGGAKPDTSTNHRNGTSEKTVLTDEGPVAIEVPRDREGPSSRGSSPSTSGGSRASTTRFWRCTPAGSRSGKSKRIWRRSTRPTCRRR